MDPPNVEPVTVKLFNAHSMKTRAKSGFVQPKIQPRLPIAHIEPKSVKPGLNDPQWKAPMQSKYDALQHNNTWTLVPLPPNRQTIGCKWIF